MECLRSPTNVFIIPVYMFFLVTFFGLIRRCEKFNSIPIILILFTNKIVACVRTHPPLKKGKGGLYTGDKNIA